MPEALHPIVERAPALDAPAVIFDASPRSAGFVRIDPAEGLVHPHAVLAPEEVAVLTRPIHVAAHVSEDVACTVAETHLVEKLACAGAGLGHESWSARSSYGFWRQLAIAEIASSAVRTQ